MKNPRREWSANFHEPEKDDDEDDNEYRDNRTLNVAYFHILNRIRIIYTFPYWLSHCRFDFSETAFFRLRCSRSWSMTQWIPLSRMALLSWIWKDENFPLRFKINLTASNIAAIAIIITLKARVLTIFSYLCSHMSHISCSFDSLRHKDSKNVGNDKHRVKKNASTL